MMTTEKELFDIEHDYLIDIFNDAVRKLYQVSNNYKGHMHAIDVCRIGTALLELEYVSFYDR